MEIRKFGTTKDGQEALLYILKNQNGMEAHVTNFGALLIDLIVPDRNGTPVDVALGYGSFEDFEKFPSAYGAPIGRVANRIAYGRFTLNGKEYKVPAREGQHYLHAIPDIWYRRMWNAETDEDADASSVTFFMQSPDGDQGFPGNLDVEVTYTLTNGNELLLEYYGLSDQDTLFNMTNHTYFNLNGEGNGDILNHKVTLKTDLYTPAAPDCLPTGEIASVEGTAFDFRAGKTIGEGINSDDPQIALFKGFDHNFLINGGKMQDQSEYVGRCAGDQTGIVMEIYSDLPAMQMYTNNTNRETIGKKGHAYGDHAAVCFETHFAPDAIHHDNFAQPILKAGKEFVTMTVYRFYTE